MRCTFLIWISLWTGSRHMKLLAAHQHASGSAHIQCVWWGSVFMLYDFPIWLGLFCIRLHISLTHHQCTDPCFPCLPVNIDLIKAIIVNGLHLYSAFQHLHSTPKRFTMASHSPIHSHTGGCCHARCSQAHWEQFGIQCLNQGHRYMDSWSWDSNHRPFIIGQLHTIYYIKKKIFCLYFFTTNLLVNESIYKPRKQKQENKREGISGIS